MVLKKTIGYRVSFIIFGAILSACNALVSSQNTKQSENGIQGIAAVKQVDHTESRQAILK